MNPRILICIFGIICLLVGGFSDTPYAQENSEGNGQLTVPWNEFKKLLHLRENEIVLSLETFQKLLAQTGNPAVPKHFVKGGNVVMTRAEFKKLVDQMKPPTSMGVQPPFEYLVTKAVYSGEMNRDNTSFTAVFSVHVLKEGVYLKIPILPQRIALQDVKVEGKPALVVSENGYHHVVLTKPGENVVTASFSVRSFFEKGPHKLDLTIQQTPITLLNLTMPLQDIDVEIPQAQQLLSSVSNGRTNVSAIIAPGTSISIRWRKKTAVTEKLPPKLYSEVHQLVSIEDDMLKINSDIHLNILHSEIDQVRLVVPEGTNILRISGEAVGEWQEVVQNDQRVIVVPFTYGKKGAASINIAAETALSDNGSTTQFSGVRVLDTVREIGFVGIELNTSAEVNVADSEGLEKVPVQKLPHQLYDKSVKPLILAFKYLKHPYDLVLDIKKHKKIAVPVATINSANVVSLFTEDGKVVHRLVYRVRNSAKQFLAIQMPEGAQIWSVFVGDQPVECSTDAQGKLLVPLIRSRSQNNRLDTFPVEVLYCMVEDSFSPLSFRKSSLPAVDLIVSQLIWSVYLPNDYAYIHFNSTLEKEEIIRGVNLFSAPNRRYDEKAMKEFVNKIGDQDAVEGDTEKLKKIYKGNEYRSRFRNQSIPAEQMSSQLGAELEFSRRLEGLRESLTQPTFSSSGGIATGVLPIQIQVPTGGQVYRFARTIITAEDPLTMSVFYAQSWIVDLLRWLTYALFLWGIYWRRHALSAGLQKLTARLRLFVDFCNKHEASMGQAVRSRITPFLLLGLFIVFWFVSKSIAFLVFFLFWSSVVYQFYLHRQRKA